MGFTHRYNQENQSKGSIARHYLDLCQRIVQHGEWAKNERTGKRCLTLINADLTYDVASQQFPIVTTRKSYWKAAIAQSLGYIRGYDNAEDFRKLGTKTWVGVELEIIKNQRQKDLTRNQVTKKQ